MPFHCPHHRWWLNLRKSSQIQPVHMACISSQYIHPSIHACMHAYRHTYIHCIYIYIYIYVFNAHTHIHTYIYIHMYVFNAHTHIHIYIYYRIIFIRCFPGGSSAPWYYSTLQSCTNLHPRHWTYQNLRAIQWCLCSFCSCDCDPFFSTEIPSGNFTQLCRITMFKGN